MLGLVDAWSKFNPGREAQFQTYAGFRIRGAIMDCLRTADPLPRNVRKAIKDGLMDLEFVDAALAVQLKSPEMPADERFEIAERSEWVRESLARLPYRKRLVLEEIYLKGRLALDVMYDIGVKNQCTMSQIKLDALRDLKCQLEASA